MAITRYNPIPLAERHPLRPEHWEELWKLLFSESEWDAQAFWIGTNQETGERLYQDAEPLREILPQAFEEAPARWRDCLHLKTVLEWQELDQVMKEHIGVSSRSAVTDLAQKGRYATRRNLFRLLNQGRDVKISSLFAYLPVRVEGALRNYGYLYNDLPEEEAWNKLRSATDAELLKLKNFGRKSLKALDRVLFDLGRPRFSKVASGDAHQPMKPRVRTMKESTARSYVRSLLRYYSLTQIHQMLREESDRCPVCDKSDCELHKDKRHARLLNS